MSFLRMGFSSHSCSLSLVLSFEDSEVLDVGSEDVPAKFSSYKKANVSISEKKLKSWKLTISFILDRYDLQLHYY